MKVIGRVTSDTGISELTSYNLGENIGVFAFSTLQGQFVLFAKILLGLDMSLVEALVQNSHKYTHMFHGESEQNGNGL